MMCFLETEVFCLRQQNWTFMISFGHFPPTYTARKCSKYLFQTTLFARPPARLLSLISALVSLPYGLSGRLKWSPLENQKGFNEQCDPVLLARRFAKQLKLLPVRGHSTRYASICSSDTNTQTHTHTHMGSCVKETAAQTPLSPFSLEKYGVEYTKVKI